MTRISDRNIFLADTWRYSLFSLGAIFSLYQFIYFYANLSTSILIFIGFHLAIVFVAWFSASFALCLFVVSIPLINGFCVLSPNIASIFVVHSAVFSSIYIIWFCKKVVIEKISIAPASKAGFYLDLLVTCVFFSLVFQCRYYPLDILWSSIWDKSILDQMNPLFCIPASWTLSQGLLLYRMIESDPLRDRLISQFPRLAAIQTIILIVFSAVQLFTDTPAWRSLHHVKYRGIRSPFDDLQSYSSYVILLYGFFLMGSVRGNGKFRVVSVCFVGLLGSCIYFSLSRIAILITLTMTVTVIGYFVFRKKRMLFISAFVGIIGLFLIITVLSKQGISDVLIPFTKHSFSQMKSPSSIKYRMNRWKIYLQMIQSSSLIGHGIGSSFRRYPIYSGFNEAKKTGLHTYSYQEPENAHNYFIQIAVELGLSGLVVFIMLIVFVFRNAVGFSDRSSAVRIGLVAGLAGYAATWTTSHPLLLPSHQFLFWFFAAVASTSGGSSMPTGIQLFQIPRKEIAWICGTVLTGYMLLISSKADRSDYELGFYDWEKWGGQSMRWTKKNALTSIMASSDIIRMNVAVFPQNIGENGLDMMLKVNGETLDHLHFFNSKENELIYYIPGIKGNRISILTEVSDIFIPLKLGVNKDSRELGIALSPMSFLSDIPATGIGFYGNEDLPPGSLSAWNESRVHSFRWSGMHASLALTDEQGINGCIVYLSVRHPDVHEKPVSVTIHGNAFEFYNQAISDGEWKKVPIRPIRYPNRRILTFHVSRAWCPALSGISHDIRMLGVKVAVSPANDNDHRSQ